MLPPEGRKLTDLVSHLEHHLKALQKDIRGRAKAGGARQVQETIAALQSALEEMRANEEELTESRAEAEADRERYRDLFELAPDGYLVTDAYGVITEANHAACQLVKVPPAYIFRKPLAVYVARDNLHPLFKLLAEMRQSRNRGEVVLRMVRRNGETLVAHGRAAAVRAADGRLRFIRWIIRDVTGQFNAQEELARHREQLKALTSEMTQVEQRERRRIAEGIHDQAIHTLALAKLTLSSATAAGPPRQSAIEEGVRLVGQAMDDLRSLIFELSPPVLYELGLSPAVEWLADQFHHRHGMDIEVRTDIPPKVLPVDIRVTLFHATRELLVNVLKHAKATRVTITMRLNHQGVRVCVIDNGRGIRSDLDGQHNKGFGIFNLRNRLEHLGGRFRIRSTPARFTCAKIFVPLPDKDPGPD
jgi:PAS domain S-box-containing protein